MNTPLVRAQNMYVKHISTLATRLPTELRPCEI